MSAIADAVLELNDPCLEAALEEVARKEWILESLRAQADQDRLAREMGELNSIDGLGRVARQIDPFAYHDWAKKLGSYDCWRDKGFNAYIDRIAPETKVRCHGTRIQSGYRGPTNCDAFPSRPPKFHKSYGPL